MTSSNKIYWRFITYFLLFGIIIALVTSIINYNVKFNNIRNDIKHNSQYIAQIKKEFIEHYMQDIKRDIYAITQNPLFINYLADPSNKNKTLVQDIFLNTALSNTSYFQVRFLDKNGKEQVRVDRKRQSDDVVIIADKKLQNKSNRYYFKDSIASPANSYWFSKLDLNVEHEQIERPLRPTIRVAKQVFYHGKFQGIVIINIEMSNLLDQLRNVKNFDVYLIDKNGFFLINPDKTKSWSQYLNHYVAQTEFPNYDMTKLLTKDDYHENNFHIFSLEKQFKNNEGIELILKTKSDYIYNLKRDNYTIALYLGLLIILISIPTGFLIAIKPAKIQDELNFTLKENLKYTDIIDKYVAVSSTDIKGYITSVSTAMCDISGYNSNELIGKKISVFKSGYMGQEVYKDLWNKISSGLVWQGELQNKNKDGDIFWLRTTILPQYDDQKKLAGYMAISSDITDKKLIEFISERDKLTTLYNRMKLDKVLENEVNRVQRYHTALSLIILDIDHFKSVNDTFGHQAGDSVLIELANILQSNIRNTDVLGRWGGEEFLIICPHTDINGTKELAEHLRVKIENYDFKIVGKKSSSFGVTTFQAGDNIESFLKRADDNLYSAKEDGRNKVVTQ